MIKPILLLLFYAYAYKETLTFLTVSSSSSLAIINFTDDWTDPHSPITNYGIFPESLYSLLNLSQTKHFEATFAWGTPPPQSSERITIYNKLKNEKIRLDKAGFTLISDSSSNWKMLTSLLSSLFCSYINVDDESIKTKEFQHIHTNDFLCKENFIRAQHLLPCRGNKGFSTLFGSFYSSKYVSLTIAAETDGENKYKYTIRATVEVSSKEPLKSVYDECISSSIELIEDAAIESHPLHTLQISKLSLTSPSSFENQPIKSSRKIGDVRYRFDTTYTHVLKNNSPELLNIAFTEVFPNIVTPLLHTFSHSPIKISKFKKGWTVDFELILKPNEEISIKFQLEKKLLSFEEYPTDPQRGWDIPSTIIIYKGNTLEGILPTDDLLVMTPEPDFSMPFNVICITGSVIAFFYTSIQTLQLWKEKIHWSNPHYETSVIKAQKIQTYVKNGLLGISLVILYILDRKGILKLLG
ncbi:unnamed protein product [Blepharisma stoltei]|uniref:GPI transamidase component PIG-T n=1 Tax=Blepharisma stoltei TaxID=1481888 RepID=A0AAU9IB77_9CILI|nr:unnamed protein product [Blepharisma stoltei]